MRYVFFTVLLFSSFLCANVGPGSLDPTFGSGGKLIDGSAYGSYDVAIQPDGKIVAVGGGGVGIAVFRYNIDGSSDITFGGTGRVFIALYQVAVDVAIQPDGKIVVAGRDPDGEVFGSLVRLTSNGSLDTSFGTDGVYWGWFLPSISAIQPDGKLLISQGARLFRLNQDGSHDATFADGCRTLGYSSYHYPNHRSPSVIQPDGKILTAFTKVEIEDLFSPVFVDFGVFRCDPNGALDTTFGSGGIVITPIGSGRDDEDVAHSIAVQVDGKIVVAGQNRTRSNPSNWKLTIVRYNSNGSLDAGFGAGGIMTMPTGITHWLISQDAIALQTDGKIVVSTTIENGSNRDFALVRYDPNGSLDTTFGGGDGISTVDFENGSNDAAHGMAIDGEGRAVVVGTSAGFALARVLLNPAAAEVSVSGRVMTSNGRGLGNTIISATDSLGVTRTAKTNTFGYYSFHNILSGDVYAFAVRSKRYQFEPRTVFVDANLTGVDFVAN